jgi:glycosyltransferase involved in cell wall biosynthesis
LIKSIAIISNYAPSLVNFRGPLIEALVARGITVFALAPDYDAAWKAKVEALGATPVDYVMDRAGMSPRRDAGAFLQLYRLLRRLRPDASLGYFIKPVIYGSLAARLARVPHRFALVEGLGYHFTDRGEAPTRRRRAMQLLLKSLFRRAFRACERVFFLNPDDLAAFVDERALDPAKAEVIGAIGLDLADYPPARLPPAYEAPVFLFIGRMLREKGIREFVEAARLVRASGAQARFVMLGEGDVNPGAIAREEIEAWVEEGVVEWPGQVADVRPWLAAASIFVLPSWREGWPRSTQEAMATGRAIITTDVPGCRETVIEGVNGVLVPPRDPAALAEAMLRFVRDPTLAARMGPESRRLAEERLDVHAANARLLRGMGIEA